MCKWWCCCWVLREGSVVTAGAKGREGRIWSWGCSLVIQCLVICQALGSIPSRDLGGSGGGRRLSCVSLNDVSMALSDF